jgi:hypothetical protein
MDNDDIIKFMRADGTVVTTSEAELIHLISNQYDPQYDLSGPLRPNQKLSNQEVRTLDMRMQMTPDLDYNC